MNRKLPWRVGPNIEEITPYSPGKPIEETRREYGLSEIVKLASNENPLGPSPKAVAAVRAALADLHRYPDGSCRDLRQAIAASLGVPDEMVFLGNGSNEILELLLRTFVQPGEEILTAWPSFVVYPLAAKALRIPCRMVPLSGMTFDLSAMAKAVTPATRLIIVCNPNNPTGTKVGRDEVGAFLAAVPEDVLVVFDEAYVEYAEGSDFPDTLSLLLGGDSRIVIARTFSKIHGLAGLRVGYGVAHPDLVGYVNRVRQPFNVNSLAQAGALAALEDTEHVMRSLEANRRGKTRLMEAFDSRGIKHVPTWANFMLFRVGPRSAEVFTAMLKRGVIVRPLAGYDLGEWLRVTIGDDHENDAFLTALDGALAELGVTP
jgi:histidinol-phosphate aminotransferase